MNAYELADELAFKHIAGDDSGAFSSKIITMLRQQQTEIAELKHMNRNWQISENILLLELEKLQHCELTDEEILFIADEVNIPDAPDIKDLIDFARAILRKAQG